MPNNYTFLDSNASVQTASSSIVSGAHQPIVQIGSVLVIVPVSFSAGTAVLGSVATLQGTNPWVTIMGGSVAAVIIGGSVVTSNSSVMLLSGANVIGSVLVLQGTNPWNISSIYGNISGSVLAFQAGTYRPSAIGYLKRNDALASTLGADLTYGEATRDSAGRVVIRPFAAEEARIEGYASVVSTSVTTLVAAAGVGLRNYITDLWFANTGAATTLITLSDGAGSILGYTIAPTTSGSNLPGLMTPIRTGENATFDFKAATATSILYATVKGYKAP